MEPVDYIVIANKGLYTSSLKLWGIIAVSSIVLFQLPLYYSYVRSTGNIYLSYQNFGLSFFWNWYILMGFSLISCWLVFRFIGQVYQYDWSLFGIKLATLLSAEIAISMIFVPYFLLADQSLVIPNYFIVVVMLLSAAIGVWLMRLDKLRTLLRKRAEAME